MYVPKVFATDEPTAYRVIDENPFGILIRSPEVDIAPLPFLLRDGRLYSHMARANSLARDLEGASVSAVFQGPHSYVSPRYYENPREHVPTWNYVVAHVRGRIRKTGDDETLEMLREMCVRFEPEESGYRLDWIDDGFARELLQAIIGFEVEIESIEAKLKLSQNRSPTDRARVESHLSVNAPDVAKWMRSSR
jgi:transcriptional regulator